ncbi:hypothetical protein BCR39DRAFT_531880 [Naematelia encephala]|uniref:GAR domain-containing protein n=1 Tax=Naematelia encephala TaxID=71784 RepID=A0A1Y2B5Y4_9TREE|nr:hypothetical protein BCR39DRAFT_531880 [Naematelia encephala]
MSVMSPSDELSELVTQLSITNDTKPTTPSKSVDPLHLLATIEGLIREVAKLLNKVYEIEEVRHAASSQSSTHIDALLQDLDSSISRLSPQIDTLASSTKSYTGGDERAITESFEELQGEWARVSEQHEVLKEEMKEDGWLVRFRTTAEQAEAMMDPLQKSLIDCSHYVESISSSPVPVPYESELDELPSLSALQNMMRSHEALRNTYLASIAKILKMMDKSIADRPTKNGEVLRRYGDMCARFTSLQRGLQQLEARVRIVLSQHHGSPADDVEVLLDVSSPSSPMGGYFDVTEKRSSFSHRSSISSTRSGSSRQSPLIGKSQYPLSVDVPILRKQRSSISNTSASTARTPSERPRWNASPRIIPESMSTPTNRRLNSYSSIQRAPSPSPSGVSMGTSSSPVSPPAVSGSRIPVMSPRSRTTSYGAHINVPSLSVSNSHGQHFLSDAGDMRRFSKTPEPPRLRTVSNVHPPLPRSSLTPVGNRSVSGPAPRTAPAGPGRVRAAPPSSFRSNTPTPSGLGRPSFSRPSSRLSMMSYAVHPSVSLQPFVASKYDLLDQHVHSLLTETGFNLLVSRVDASMKRGHRRADGEEWKGEYVFGAGQKVSAVKLLQIAGRAGSASDMEKRIKCLVRVGGAWTDLKGVLEERLREAEP